MEEASEVGSNQSILEHLNDLRVRLTWAAVALIVATVISFIFAEQILNFLMRPYNASVIGGATLQTLRPTEGIETFFKVALLSGAIIAMPIILYQFWLFISPALQIKKKNTFTFLFPAHWFYFCSVLRLPGLF